MPPAKGPREHGASSGALPPLPPQGLCAAPAPEVSTADGLLAMPPARPRTNARGRGHQPGSRGGRRNKLDQDVLREEMPVLRRPTPPEGAPQRLRPRSLAAYGWMTAEGAEPPPRAMQRMEALLSGI
mmetsp:Transcript_59893/g.165750  ORF Transcript_59893/g.165750 Transcript_59893/m.165750 type:complete len:127 (+) Transcript_59893:147-527(+)